MRNTVAALALGALIVFSAQSASAISIQADIPVAADWKITSGGASSTYSGDTSGFMAGINFGLLGLQYEAYTVSHNFTGQTGTLDITMLDLALNLPIPFVNIAVGAGAGTGKVGGAAFGSGWSDASLTQYFLQIGIPFAAVFDVHLGYRVLSGTNSQSGVDVKSDINTTSLGIRFGF